LYVKSKRNKSIFVDNIRRVARQSDWRGANSRRREIEKPSNMSLFEAVLDRKYNHVLWTTFLLRLYQNPSSSTDRRDAGRNGCIQPTALLNNIHQLQISGVPYSDSPLLTYS